MLKIATIFLMLRMNILLFGFIFLLLLRLLIHFLLGRSLIRSKWFVLFSNVFSRICLFLFLFFLKKNRIKETWSLYKDKCEKRCVFSHVNSLPFSLLFSHSYSFTVTVQLFTTNISKLHFCEFILTLF